MTQAAISKADEAHVYELLKDLNDESVRMLDEFFAEKRQANVSDFGQRRILIERMKSDPERWIKGLLANYGFRHNNRFRKTTVLEIDLPPHLQRLAIVNGDLKFLTGDFRDANWVKTGCLGEMAFIFFMMCVLHCFNINHNIPLVSTKNLLYGGDGGNDVRMGQSLLDLKYRDDNPSKGMALTNKFITSPQRDPNCLLVQISNATNDEKLGHSVVETPINKITNDLPLAIAGWVSVAEYDDRKKPFKGYSDWIVDDLNAPSELIFRLVEEINDNEGLFEI